MRKSTAQGKASPSNIFSVSALDLAEIEIVANEKDLAARTVHEVLRLKGLQGLDKMDVVSVKNLHWCLRMIWAGEV
jgi:hypothetical protein